jgi:hypothetical protein
MLKSRGELFRGAQFSSAKFQVDVVELGILRIVCVDKADDKTKAWSEHLDPHIVPLTIDN